MKWKAKRMPKNFKARVSQARKLQRRSLTQFYFSTHTKKKKDAQVFERIVYHPRILVSKELNESSSRNRRVYILGATYLK